MNGYGTDTAPVLSNELLLDITGDALRPMVEQLREVTKFHDFACRLDSCKQTAGQPARSDVETLWGALAALPDGRALADATVQLSATNLWAPIFKILAAQHVALERAAVAPSTRAYETKALLGSPGSPDRGGLGGILRDAATRGAVFAASGLFDPTGLASLRTGLQKEKRDDVQRTIASRTSDAEDANSKLQQKRAEAVQALVLHLQGAQDLDAVVNRVKAKALDFDLLTTNLSALRAGIEADQRAAADFASSFDVVAKKASATGFAVTRAEQRFEVTANDPAKRPRPPTWDDVRLVAAPWKLQAEAGEIVNFDVTGTWSPVCAFGSSVAPDGKPIDATGAFTGSEGFIGRVDNGRYTARQYSSYYTTSQGTTTTSTKCEGLSYSAGLSIWGVGITPQGTTSQNDCETTENGTRSGTNDTTSTTNDHRESSSFAVGIRLADTPFPSAPAGALLAVVMPRDSSSRTAQLDVRVVAPRTSLVIEKASDVYLVVNDSQCALDTGTLTVHYARLTPTGNLAKKLGTVMADALKDIRDLEPRFRAEGRMLPEDTAARRQAAVARIDAALPAGTFTNFPEFQSFFFSWLDGELAQLRRKVEVDALEHQRHLSVLELNTLADDLRRADKASRYLTLSTRWAIENVDASLLSASATALGEGVSDFLIPLTTIRYPNALTYFAKSKDTAALARLRSASLSTSLSGLVKDEIVLVKGFSKALNDAMLEATTVAQNVRIVGIAIPNPAFTGAPPESKFRAVDPATSATVWEQITKEHRLRFALSPELIFDRLGGTGVLLCGDGVPVINGMALYVGDAEGGTDPNDPKNVLPTLVPVRFDAQMMFPGASGNLTYSFTGDQWLSTNLRVLFGQPVYAANVLTQQFATAQQQAGLSPFARIDVALERIATSSLLNAPEIDLVYQLDAQSLGSTGLPGVSTCHANTTAFVSPAR